MKKKKNKIWLIGVVLLGLFWGMFQLPVVKDGLFDLQTKMVNRDLIAHSVGMNYYLGQILCEDDLDWWRETQQCMTDDIIADEARIPWSRGYGVREHSIGVTLIGVREIADSEDMLKVIDLTLRENHSEVYGIKLGTDRREAEKILKKRGFQKKAERPSSQIDGYWKAGIRIRLWIKEEKVTEIQIYLYNRKDYEAIMEVIKQSEEY